MAKQLQKRLAAIQDKINADHERNSQLDKSSVSQSYYGTESDAGEIYTNRASDLNLQQLQLALQQQHLQQPIGSDLLDSYRSTDISFNRGQDVDVAETIGEERKEQANY